MSIVVVSISFHEVHFYINAAVVALLWFDSVSLLGLVKRSYPFDRVAHILLLHVHTVVVCHIASEKRRMLKTVTSKFVAKNRINPHFRTDIRVHIHI